MTIELEVSVTQIVGDTLTPVGIYLALRDRYPGTVLLESAEYQPNENCYTFIGVQPLAGIMIEDGELREQYPGESQSRTALDKNGGAVRALERFLGRFRVRHAQRPPAGNGAFGYIAHDAVQCFEDITLKAEWEEARRIPLMRYHIYAFVIAVNHYKNEMYIINNRCTRSQSEAEARAAQRELEYCMRRGVALAHNFSLSGGETSNFDDTAHLEMIARCKEHVFRGDVFQIVPSRRFSQAFRGDEFNVYRALRIINPSPYLFYFDYGSYKIFGSSPEAELVVQKGRASIYPIAGTYKRTADEKHDAAQVELLREDPKENAEHVMLVDLARNDLSKHCKAVRVERFKEVHYYSHVIHLVSKVSGELAPQVSAVQLLADTFPAGTLSGAPKYKALELIDRYERGARGFYGGAIGFLSFSGECNHAIMIRSFLSKDNVLYRQAGGGVVADSVPEREIEEVKNKLAALKAALAMAENLSADGAA